VDVTVGWGGDHADEAATHLNWADCRGVDAQS